jgi:hypothetical protein
MEAERALTCTTAGAQALASRRHLAIEGLENLSVEEDLILPRWRIVQYPSTIEGQPGQFNDNLTGELRHKLELIVLKVMPSRARFNDDRKPVCMSQDGHYSSGGKTCGGCPYAQWLAHWISFKPGLKELQEQGAKLSIKAKEHLALLLLEIEKLHKFVASISEEGEGP